MKRLSLERWRKPKPDDVPVRLPFSDIMEFAMALLSISPRELRALGWTFAQRKRLLDHMLAFGRDAEGIEPNKLATKQIELRLPKKDLVRLQHFAVRGLPKATSDGGHRPRAHRPRRGMASTRASLARCEL